MSMLTGTHRPGTGVHAVTLDARDRAKLLAALGRFVRTSVRGGDPGSLTHSEACVVGVVSGLLLRHDAVVRARPVTGRSIGDLEDWSESRRGMSPMRYLTERRLAAGHARLLNAGAKDEVTAIATDLGFAHLGRFATAYRNAFGESPSQTLRRGHRARRGGPVAQPRGSAFFG
jgi:hypothetical protein